MPYEQRWGRTFDAWWRVVPYDVPLPRVPNDELVPACGEMEGWDVQLRDVYLDRRWEEIQRRVEAAPEPGKNPLLEDCDAGCAMAQTQGDHWCKPDGTADPNPGPQAQPLLPIEKWWLSTARTDLDSVLPKMQEYGSFDLVAVGQLMAHAMQWDDITPEQLTELGCLFYLQGKVARAFDALRQHRLPSDDTVYDIGVYSMMIRRIRDVGGWK